MISARESPPIRLGSAFFFRHVWVVCSLPDSEGNVVAVNCTTKRSASAGISIGTDLNCILRKEDHPSIDHDTVMAYEAARVLTLEEQQCILNDCPRRPDFSDALISRIQGGALRSDLTSQRIQKMIRESMVKQAARARRV